MEGLKKASMFFIKHKGLSPIQLDILYGGFIKLAGKAGAEFGKCEGDDGRSEWLRVVENLQRAVDHLGDMVRGEAENSKDFSFYFDMDDTWFRDWLAEQLAGLAASKSKDAFMMKDPALQMTVLKGTSGMWMGLKNQVAGVVQMEFAMDLSQVQKMPVAE